MSLQDAITAALPDLRREAEGRMLDVWAIGTSEGWTYQDGADVRTVDPLFTTRGRLKAAGTVIQESEAGGREVAESRRELHIPVASPAVPTGALAQCIRVHRTSDPTLLGTVVRLSGPAPGSQTTARRLEVTEVLS